MWALVENGAITRVLRDPQPFTHQDIQYPSNFTQLATLEEKVERGIYPVISDPYPDQSLYVVTGSTFEISGQTVLEHYETAPKPPASKQKLKAVAASKRYEVEIGGITINGTPIKTDRESQSLINGANNLVAVTNANVKWKTDAGFVQLNPQAISAIAVAVGTHVQNAFSAEADINALIDNDTITTEDQVRNWAGWNF